MITRAERRKRNWKKAIRKRRIAKEIYPSISEDSKEYYDNLHQFSKNKIHCSCGFCCAKTRNKSESRRKIPHNYAPNYNPSIRDKKSLERLDYEENMYYYE